jgi:phosphoribosyl 1,2-cyclic phosphodiesterase
MSPERLENRIRSLMGGFFDAGFKNASDVDVYLAGLPAHRLGGFGGNTPCIEVRSDQTQLIIDAGSGIRSLGYQLMPGPCGRGQGEVHLAFTHFHWDHLIGLPFFTPIFIPGNTIHVYAVQEDLENVFKVLFKKPYFPVNLDQLGARIVYHRLEPRKTVKIGDLEVTPYALDHPDPCWGYRIAHGGRVFSHCVDTEATRVTREELGPDLPLYQGVDLMVFDAQYTLIETIEKVHWGHAAASIGIDIALRESIPRVLFMHHDPASDDEKIALAEAQARRYHESQLKTAKRNGETLPGLEWSFVREGYETEV